MSITAITKRRKALQKNMKALKKNMNNTGNRLAERKKNIAEIKNNILHKRMKRFPEHIRDEILRQLTASKLRNNNQRTKILEVTNPKSLKLIADRSNDIAQRANNFEKLTKYCQTKDVNDHILVHDLYRYLNRSINKFIPEMDLIWDWFRNEKGFRKAAKNMYDSILLQVANFMIQICKSNIKSEMLLIKSIIDLWIIPVFSIYGFHPGTLAPTVNTRSTHFFKGYMDLVNGIEKFLIRFVTSSKLSPEIEVRIKKIISELKSFVHLDLFLSLQDELLREHYENNSKIPQMFYPLNNLRTKMTKSRPFSNIVKDFSQTVHNTLKNRVMI